MSPRKSRSSNPKTQSSPDQPSATPAPSEPELVAEELEERIAPRLAANHNETRLAAD